MRFLARLAVLLLLPVAAWAQPAATPTVVQGVPDRAVAVRELAEREVESQKLVALSIAVAQDSVIVFEHHIGFEDREAKIAAGPGTMYRWASISKPVTAVAALQLAESGKLDLDADVRTLVPEFPEKPWPITSRQLLCHQGGVVHYTNGKVIKSPIPAKPEHPYEDVVLALGAFKESPLVCEPGTKYSYTTHGYMLLGAAVERAAGARFWPLVRDSIAGPAGMTSFQPDYQWVRIEHRAVGYRKNKSDEMVRSTDTDVSWKLAGGGFISTVGDLSRFSVALMNHKLIKPETFVSMCTAQKLSTGEATTYALGLSVGEYAGKQVVAHSGSQEKSATYLLMIPEERLSVAIMSNTEGASLQRLSRAIAARWLDLPTPDAAQDEAGRAAPAQSP